MRRHAKDPITTGPSAASESNALTLETWALAISGATNIEEYCMQHICSMQKDTWLTLARFMAFAAFVSLPWCIVSVEIRSMKRHTMIQY